MKQKTNTLRLTVKALLGWERMVRDITILPDDVFLTSYPRSGNTWTRFLIGSLIHHDDPITFANIEKKVPDIYVNSDALLLKISRPRILKSHQSFDPRYRKVIYIVRDPRDVAISFYHFHIKMGLIDEEYPLQKFIARFVAGEVERFGSWGEHVGGWLGARGETSEFLLLRYEDLLKDTFGELNKVASFLGLPHDEARVTRAIELSSADKMRKMEKEQSALWKPIKNSRKDKPFVRGARAGGWRDEMPIECSTQIEAAWTSVMAKLAY